MNSILEKIESKPSKALEAMVRGMEQLKDNPNFQFHIFYFGGKAGPVCVGCAATCALIELSGKPIDSDSWANNDYDAESYVSADYCAGRAKFYGFDEEEVARFETAIDQARRGFQCLAVLFTFCGALKALEQLWGEDFPQNLERFCIDGSDWEPEIPKVNALIEYLQTKGL